MRTYTQQTILFSAKAADGASTPQTVIDFTHLELELCLVGFTGTVKFVCSDADDAPAFGSAASLANPWTYVKSIDLIDGSAVNGGTGITGVATSSITNLEVNINGKNWFGAIISGYSAGALTLKLKGIAVSGS
jgi:hypothetical protein